MFRFDARKQFALMDGIVKAKGVYLQPASSGIKVSEGLANPKVLIELPAELPRWESIYLDVVFSRLVNSGFSKKEAKQAAAEYIFRMREFWSKGIRNLMVGKEFGK
ncbi:hypothetical protein D6Z43_10315 [Pseudomonas sp. DY-1]|nr:hypothetical protein D6Z43_10315 [Pseudomonas sp. DY-1]